ASEVWELACDGYTYALASGWKSLGQAGLFRVGRSIASAAKMRFSHAEENASGWAYVQNSGLPQTYGQRLAVSSHPSARAAGPPAAATAGCGIRIGCWTTAVTARVVLFPATFLLSDNNGTATRNASTSFSSRASSSSFCLRTSYTFFMLGHPHNAQIWGRRLDSYQLSHFCQGHMCLPLMNGFNWLQP